MIWQLREAGAGSIPKGLGPGKAERMQVADVAARIRKFVPSLGSGTKEEECEFWVDTLARAFVGRLDILSLRGVLLPGWSERFGGMSLYWESFLLIPSTVDAHELLLGTVDLDAVSHSLKSNRAISELDRKNWSKRLEVLKRFESQFRRWYPILSKLSYLTP